MVESLELNQATYTDNSQRAGTRGLGRRRIARRINAVVDADHFRCAVRAAVGKLAARVVAGRDDEGRFPGHFAQQFRRAQVDHEVLRLRGERKTQPGERLEKEGAVGGLVGEVNMDVINPELREDLGKVEGVAAAFGGFVAPAEARCEFVHHGCGPAAVGARAGFHHLADGRRRVVQHGGPEGIEPGVPERLHGRVDGSHRNIPAGSLEGQHLVVDKGLRQHRPAAEQIGQPRLSAGRSRDGRFHAGKLANLARGRQPAAMGKGKWGRVPKPNPERQSSVRSSTCGP